MSTCVKCGGHHFKVQETAPQGSAFVLYFVECSSCGVPVGAIEANNVGALLDKLTAKIQNIEHQYSQLEYDINQIKNELRKH